MSKTIRVAAAQTVEIIGDVAKASAIAVDLVKQSKDAGASLICFPECFLQGYVCERPHVERFALSVSAPEMQKFLNSIPENSPSIVLGFIEALPDGYANSAAIIQNGKIAGCYRKTHLLPRETMFIAGNAFPLFSTDDLRFGVNICNDANFPVAAQSIREQGADLLVCCANNMLPRGVAENWKDKHNAIRGQRCRETGLWLLSSDVTGCRDGLVALGPTSLLNPRGDVIQEVPLNQTALLLGDITL